MTEPDAAERYAAWVEATSPEDMPTGDVMSDLAALGEARYRDIPALEVVRRVAFAREHGRPWPQIAQYLGMTERQARVAYGTPAERRQAHQPKLIDAARDFVDAIRDLLVGSVEAVRDRSRHQSS